METAVTYKVAQYNVWYMYVRGCVWEHSGWWGREKDVHGGWQWWLSVVECKCVYVITAKGSSYSTSYKVIATICMRDIHFYNIGETNNDSNALHYENEMNFCANEHWNVIWKKSFMNRSLWSGIPSVPTKGGCCARVLFSNCSWKVKTMAVSDYDKKCEGVSFKFIDSIYEHPFWMLDPRSGFFVVASFVCRTLSCNLPLKQWVVRCSVRSLASTHCLNEWNEQTFYKFSSFYTFTLGSSLFFLFCVQYPCSWISVHGGLTNWLYLFNYLLVIWIVFVWLCCFFNIKNSYHIITPLFDLFMSSVFIVVIKFYYMDYLSSKFKNT